MLYWAWQVAVALGGETVELDGESIVHMGMTRRAALRGAGITSLTALAARGSLLHSSAQDATPAAGGDYPTVEFTAKDFEFLDLPASFPGGYTRLSMTSEGPQDHHAMFMRINDGSTADDFTAALESGDLGQLLAVAVSLGGPGSIEPGVTSNVVADVTPGQYMVVCLIPDEETGMPHAAMGMIAPLEVTEASAEAAANEPPATDQTIDLADFEFQGLPEEVAAGPQTWAVTDTGEQLHELVIYRLAPGVTYDVVESIFLAPPVATPEGAIEATPEEMASPEASPQAGGPPPFTAVAGAAPMNPSATNYVELDLEAGEYFAICFIPDPETGAPHFALGMIMPFTVA